MSSAATASRLMPYLPGARRSRPPAPSRRRHPGRSVASPPPRGTPHGRWASAPAGGARPAPAPARRAGRSPQPVLLHGLHHLGEDAGGLLGPVLVHEVAPRARVHGPE